jgi:hypothetical protein
MVSLIVICVSESQPITCTLLDPSKRKSNAKTAHNACEAHTRPKKKYDQSKNDEYKNTKTYDIQDSHLVTHGSTN